MFTIQEWKDRAWRTIEHIEDYVECLHRIAHYRLLDPFRVIRISGE